MSSCSSKDADFSVEKVVSDVVDSMEVDSSKRGPVSQLEEKEPESPGLEPDSKEDDLPVPPENQPQWPDVSSGGLVDFQARVAVFGLQDHLLRKRCKLSGHNKRCVSIQVRSSQSKWTTGSSRGGSSQPVTRAVSMRSGI